MTRRVDVIIAPAAREAHVERMWGGRRQREQRGRDPQEHIASLEAEIAALRRRLAQIEGKEAHMTESVVAVLQQAKEACAARWGQGTRPGGSVPTGKICAGLALELSARDDAVVGAMAHGFLMEAIGAPAPIDIIEWNDAPDRTRADVLATFDCAIRLARPTARPRAEKETP